MENYRGISLLNIGYKIYAMMLERRLKEEINKRNIIPDNQAGFRKGRSTTDNIYILNTIVQRQLQNGEKMYATFIDIKAAFDNINR